MNKDKVIEIAKACGIITSVSQYKNNVYDVLTCSENNLSAFANAIQSHSGEAVEVICIECLKHAVETEHSAWMNKEGHVLSKVAKDNYIKIKCEIGYKGFDIPLFTYQPDQSARIKELEQRLAERDLRYRSCDAYVKELQATNKELEADKLIQQAEIDKLKTEVKILFDGNTEMFNHATELAAKCENMREALNDLKRLNDYEDNYDSVIALIDKTLEECK